jgi:hypothetical protein
MLKRVEMYYECVLTSRLWDLSATTVLQGCDGDEKN